VHSDEEVRPFFGESAEVLGTGFHPEPPAERTYSLDERRELKIASGECPMPGCAGQLDADFYCIACGNVSLPRPVPDSEVRE